MKIERGHVALLVATVVLMFCVGAYWPRTVKAQAPTQGTIYWAGFQSAVSGCSWPPGISTSGITFAVALCPVGTSGQIYAAYNGGTNWVLISGSGAQGPPGPQGIPGVAGATGATGPQGPPGTVPAKLCGSFGGGNGGQVVFNTAPCL